MRTRLVELATAAALFSLFGCNTSSAARDGSGGSTGRGSGGTEAGGIGGGGGAAGAGAVTTLSGNKPLGGLTAAESMQLCNDTYSYFVRGATWSTVCKWTGLTYAISSSAQTDQALESFCSDPQMACSQSNPGDSIGGARCDDLPSDCAATVAQYAACVADQVAAFASAVGGLPGCSKLTHDDITAVYSVEAMGSDFNSTSCAALQTACPSLNPPTPFAFTGPTDSSTGKGGSPGQGGTIGTGGSSAGGSGGTGAGGSGGTAVGGRSGAGGSTGGAGGARPGTGGAGGSVGAGGGPCDIYAAANTPCVGAYSTVRALYKGYSGNLYQVRRTSDRTTKDIPLLSAGGFVDSSVQDAFCTGACTISILYDQSPQNNALPISGPVFWLKSGGTESDAKAARITVGGHTAYGVKVVGGAGNSYRNNQAKGTAKGDQPEAMYEVADAKYWNTWCCFDFGNVETDGTADGAGTMETIYYGANKQFGSGAGSGPWLMSDMEAGVFASDQKVSTNATALTAPAFVSLMMKGFSGNRFALKGGDAQTGALTTKWDGKRPAGYSPMKKQGAIVVGTGGDGSPSGSGIFYEGAITMGCADDNSVDDAIQANVIAAGYGK